MRRFFSLLLLPSLVGVAAAQEPTKTETPPVTTEAHHPRQTWEQKFSDANLAHDGHLTREEAGSHFALVARHFDDIDVDQKGYVTKEDVRAWRIMRKAARKLAHPPADKLKPLHAFQRHLPDQRPASTGLRTAVATDAAVVS